MPLNKLRKIASGVAKAARGITKVTKASAAVTNAVDKTGVAGRVGLPMALAGIKAAQRKRTEASLRDSQEFCDNALLIAEQQGIQFVDEDAIEKFLDMIVEHALNEMAIGMAPIGAIGAQKPGSDKFPGLSTVAPDGQRAGPKTDTRSAGKRSSEDSKKDPQSKGPDTFPGLKDAAKDGQHVGPKAGTRSAEGNHPVKKNESLQYQIYNSLAGRRVRECVDSGRPPTVKDIIEMAQTEGFQFDNPGDVDNFMKIALFEKLYPVTGPTKHANQMTGDQIPGAMSVSKDQRGLKGTPKDGTIGQNKTGARSPKNKGEAPHNNYKNDGPKGKTQQFERDPKKICPVCSQKNLASSAYCGACGAVLPPHPTSKDGGIPVSIPKGGKRNTNIATDGGLPKTNSPYGGSKSKHHYLKSAPPAMTESVTRSSRVIIHDMLNLMENVVSYSPTGVHDKRLTSPAIGSVNAKAQSLGVNPIEQGELDRVVGMFQQGETTKKTSMYTGVDARLTQNIANMMGIGDSHGTSLGQTRFIAPHDLA